jgi:hypothetical protein
MCFSTENSTKMTYLLMGADYNNVYVHSVCFGSAVHQKAINYIFALQHKEDFSSMSKFG